MRVEFSKEKKEYNFDRTKTFFIMGTLYVAPILHVSYSKILPALVPEATIGWSLYLSFLSPAHPELL